MRPIDSAPPVRATPSTTRNDLYHVTDGYDFIYENQTHSKVEIAKPGFFNAYRDELRVGMMIECRLGKIEDGVEQIYLQVLTAPKSERLGDVEVSVGPSKKFTPCRHDGTLVVDEEKAA